MLYTLYRVGARGPADLDMGSKVSKYVHFTMYICRLYSSPGLGM